MFRLFLYLSCCFYLTTNVFQIDFGKKGNEQSWQVITDNVMGGLSSGKVELTQKGIKISGMQSLENNGGFVSLKSPFALYDLSDYKTMKIRYRSKGIQFGLTLEVDQRFYKPYYKINLAKEPKGWTEVEFAISNFKEYQLGEFTGDTISNKLLEDIIRIGFITSEKRAGEFEFEVDYIQFE